MAGLRVEAIIESGVYLTQNAWFCQNCGTQNDSDHCIQCGGPKLLSENAHGVLYRFFLFIIFSLLMLELVFLTNIVPTFKAVFESFGGNLPWNTAGVIFLSDILVSFRIMEMLIIIGMAIYLFFSEKIERKTKISYLIVVLVALLVLLTFSVISMFTTGGISNLK
jgi:hypothetical protein